MNNYNKKEIQIKHKNLRASKSGNRSNYMRSVQQTETDSGRTGRGKVLLKK